MTTISYTPSGLPLRGLILRGGIWTLTGRVAAALVGLALNVLLARLLAPADLGRYYLLASLLFFATIVATLGMPSGVIGMVGAAIARGRAGEARGTIVRCLTIGIASAAVLAALLIGGRPWLPQSLQFVDAGLMAVLACWIVAASVLAIGVEAFRALHHTVKANLFGGPLNSAILCVMLLVLASVAHATGLSTALLLSAATSFIAAVLAMIFLWVELRRLGPADAAPTGEIMRVSLPLLVTGLAVFFTTQSDIWLVGFFLPADQVGTYGAAARLVQLVLMPTLIANLVIAPFAARLAGREDLHTLERVARTMGLFTAVPAVAAFGLFIAAGAEVLGLAYGPAYRVGAQALVLISMGQLLNVLAGPAATILMMAGEQRGVMWISLACGLTMVVLGSVLVERWGMNGIAFSVGCASALHGVCSWALVRCRLGISTHADVRLLLAFVRARRPIIRGPRETGH